jgi:hypothetical protein
VASLPLSRQPRPLTHGTRSASSYVVNAAVQSYGKLLSPPLQQPLPAGQPSGRYKGHGRSRSFVGVASLSLESGDNSWANSAFPPRARLPSLAVESRRSSTRRSPRTPRSIAAAFAAAAVDHNHSPASATAVGGGVATAGSGGSNGGGATPRSRRDGGSGKGAASPASFSDSQRRGSGVFGTSAAGTSTAGTSGGGGGGGGGDGASGGGGTSSSGAGGGLYGGDTSDGVGSVCGDAGLDVDRIPSPSLMSRSDTEVVAPRVTFDSRGGHVSDGSDSMNDLDGLDGVGFGSPSSSRTPRRLVGVRLDLPPAALSTSSAPMVFLGGSCNPTTWRQDIAIPAFEAAGVTFYNPQVASWSPELVAQEAAAKADAAILLFVVCARTRGVASMIEVAELVARNRDVVVVIQDIELGTVFNGHVRALPRSLYPWQSHCPAMCVCVFVYVSCVCVPADALAVSHITADL